MGRWKLWFVLLLQLTFYVYSEESEEKLVKTIGKERDVTPICTNATKSVITLIVCTIRKEKSGEECRLLYRYGEDFMHECGSRFTLMKANQTVFLHLIGLRPEDSGNYTCQCTSPGNTHILHLNITVEEVLGDEDTDNSTVNIASVLIGGAIFIIIAGVFFGFICGIRSITSGLSACGSPSSLVEGDPYASLQHPASDLYQTVSYSAVNTVAARSDN